MSARPGTSARSRLPEASDLWPALTLLPTPAPGEPGDPEVRGATAAGKFHDRSGGSLLFPPKCPNWRRSRPRTGWGSGEPSAPGYHPQAPHDSG